MNDFLLHDIQRRLLSVTRCRAREQGANCTNRLSIASDDSPDVCLPHLQAKDRHAAIRNLREHDFIGEFDELSNDELKKLSHVFERNDAAARCPTPTRLPPAEKRAFARPRLAAPSPSGDALRPR